MFSEVAAVDHHWGVLSAHLLLQSDFYSYDIRSSSWNRLSDNTLKDGGPALIFDHQVRIVHGVRSICTAPLCGNFPFLDVY